MDSYICEICKKEFKNAASLVSHLSNPRNSCKINIKDYYDKYLRKENEGICQFCGSETAFYGITKGYISSICKRCKNNNPESKDKKRKTNLIKTEIKNLEKEKKKIENGYYELPIQCEICKDKGLIYKCKSRNNLARHISLSHKEVNQKDYYDKYFKTDHNEGICPITGKETTFSNLNEGYKKYFGRGTNSSDLEIQEKKKETTLKNYGVEFPCYVKTEQRISNYKNTVRKRIDLKNERLKLINILKKMTIDKTNKLQCQICGEIFKTYREISIHIIQHHKIIIKNYYDQFFKKDNEEICSISGLKTRFDCLERGYKYYESYSKQCDEIKITSKIYHQEYIHNKIYHEQAKYNVEFVNIKSLNYIGDVTNIKCLLCGKVYKNKFTNLTIGYGKCPRCYTSKTESSKGELDVLKTIKKFLEKNDILLSNQRLIKNSKTGRNFELDIYIPEKNIAIEFNGLYWHSDGMVSKDYHIMKTDECFKKGIQLIHIFEDEWNTKKEIVKSIIKNKICYNKEKFKKVIDISKCIINEIPLSDKIMFLNENHIFGDDKSIIKIGCYYKKELVSIMTFDLKNTETISWKLSRFTNKLNYKIGNAEFFLLDYFKNNFRWNEIFGYSDLRFSFGNFYKKLGFNFLCKNEPTEFFVHDGLRIKNSDYFGDTNKIQRIWDCGSLKFSLKK